MNRKVFALLTAAAFVGCGGGAEKKPDDNKPKQIELATDPAVDFPSGYQWPDYFKRATCIVVPLAGTGVSDRELEVFYKNFEENLFGTNSPFTKIDANALAKAAERRAILGGTPSSSQLTQLANKEKADFAVIAKLDLRRDPRTNTPRGIDSEILGTGTASLRGSEAKGAREIPQCNVTANQLANQDRANELREHHAGLVGRYLGKQTLANLTKLGGAATENLITITFKFFSDAEKRDMSGWLTEIEGVSEDAVQEVSADDGAREFVLKVRTSKNVNQFQRAFTAILEEKNVQHESNRNRVGDGEGLVFTKRKP